MAKIPERSTGRGLPRAKPRPLTRAVGVGVTTLLWLCVQWTPSMAWAASPTPAPGGTGGLTVTPSWENAPWEPKVQTILNVTAQVSLACCVLAFLVGGAAMGVGRIVGSYQSGTRGLQFVLGGAGGALVIASAASIVSWLIS